MEYIKLNLQNGEKFDANHLNHLEDGIFNNTNELNSVLGQIRALQTDNAYTDERISGLARRFYDWEYISETLLTPLEFSEEEFAYMFGAQLKETLDTDAVDYLYLLGMTGTPLKVIIGGPDSPDSYHSVYDMLYFIPTTCERVPHWSEDGSQVYTRLKGSFVCDYNGMTFYVILEEQDSEYTIEFSYKVNGIAENTSVDIGMVEYTSLFALGGTLTRDDIDPVIFDRLAIAINTNMPFYVNKWKTISDTEKYVEPYKFELSQTIYDIETNEPIKHTFICSKMGLNEGKITLAGLTLTYDVINQTITGSQVLSE